MTVSEGQDVCEEALQNQYRYKLQELSASRMRMRMLSTICGCHDTDGQPPVLPHAAGRSSWTECSCALCKLTRRAY